jgi:hypothetical protein
VWAPSLWGGSERTLSPLTRERDQIPPGFLQTVGVYGLGEGPCEGPVLCAQRKVLPAARGSVQGRELSPGEYGSKRVSEVSPALTAALSRGDNFPAPI